MSDDVLLDSWPRANATTAIPLARVTDNPCADILVTTRGQMLAQHFIDESFFGLTFNVNQ